MSMISSEGDEGFCCGAGDKKQGPEVKDREK